MELNKNEKFLQALEMLDHGYQVIPFSQDKNFFLVPWKSFQKERVTEKHLEEWWTKYPNANVGFITGELSNFTVIDFDIGEDGQLTKEQLEIASKLPETFTVKTPSNGFHFYYRYNPKIKQTSFKNLKIDIRNDGGLIGGWDNYCEYTKKETGKVVQGFYKRVTEKTGEMVELPEELYKTLFNAPTPPSTEKEYEKRDWTELPADYRNEYFFKYACSLFARKMTRSEVVDYFKLKYDKLENKLDFPWQEVMICINSAAKFEITSPKDIDMSGYKGEDELTLVENIVEKVLKEPPPKMLSTGFEGVDMLLDGGFLENDFICLSGESKGGKTRFALQLMKQMREYHPLFIAIEDGIEDQIRREISYQGDMPKGILVPRDKPKDGYTIEWLELKIKEAKSKYDCKMVVIDNLDWIEKIPKMSDYMSSKEIVLRLKNLSDDYKICIILIAHLKIGEKSFGYSTQRPSVYNLKGGSHIYQMAKRTLLLWRVKKKDGAYSIKDVGITTLNLELDRYRGAYGEVPFKFLEWKFKEISRQDYQQIMAEAFPGKK